MWSSLQVQALTCGVLIKWEDKDQQKRANLTSSEGKCEFICCFGVLLRVCPSRGDVARWNFPPRPFRAFLPYLAVTSCSLQACATLSVTAMQSDLFLSPVLRCLRLLPLALPEKKIFISPSSWSHMCRPRPATETWMESERKGCLSFEVWSRFNSGSKHLQCEPKALPKAVMVQACVGWLSKVSFLSY